MTQLKAKPVDGFNNEARLVGFANNDFFHAPLSSLLATTNVVSTLTGVTGDTTASIPAGWAIERVFVVNTTANAVTGGIKIGTTSGGTDVIEAMAVGANAIVDDSQSLDSAILKRLFSTSASTTLHIQAVTAWNSASLSIAIKRTKVF